MKKKEDTLNQILNAAVSIFAKYGYAGARMDKIAEEAGVNKATIYYNIGNKDALYEKVLHRLFGNAISAAEKQIEAIDCPVKKLKNFIMGIANEIDNHPGIPNILMWEHASGGNNLPEMVASEIARMIMNLAQILEQGANEGVFKKVSPMFIQLMIVPPLMFYRTSAPIRNKHSVFPEAARMLPDRASEQFAVALSDLIIAGLKK